ASSLLPTPLAPVSSTPMPCTRISTPCNVVDAAAARRGMRGSVRGGVGAQQLEQRVLVGSVARPLAERAVGEHLGDCRQMLEMGFGGALRHEQAEHQVDRLAVMRVIVERMLQAHECADALADAGH